MCVCVCVCDEREDKDWKADLESEVKIAMNGFGMMLIVLFWNSVMNTPNVLWAQRKDKVLLSVEVSNSKQPKLQIDNDPADSFGKLSLSAESSKNEEVVPYELHMEFFGELNKDESKVSVTDRNIVLVLMKSTSGPHWPRLLHAKGKPPHNIKVDWNLYMDEDDEEEEGNQANFNLGDLDDFSVSAC